MRLLLDTHVWIWSQEEVERLGATTTRALVDPETSLHVSTVSTLEISLQIAAAAYSLPAGLHKDPADRILFATAKLHDLTLLTADERTLEYGGVQTIDART